MSELSYLQLPIGGVTLRGTVHHPEKRDRHSLVVLSHGFGANRIEHFGSFVQLSRALSDAGFTVARFDRAGHGESDGSFFDTTVGGDVRDTVGIVESLIGRGLGSGRVHLVGMSLGSVVASASAARLGDLVSSLTMWSPAAGYVDELRAGRLQGRPTSVIAEQGYFDFGGNRLGPAIVEEAADFDPFAAASGYAGPVRIQQGLDDDIALPSFTERYEQVFPGRVDISLVPGADHSWADVRQREFLIGETVAFIQSNEEAADVRA